MVSTTRSGRRPARLRGSGIPGRLSIPTAPAPPPTPPINRDVDDYKKGNKQFGPADNQKMDKVAEADRKTELMAYAEAVRTILLGQ